MGIDIDDKLAVSVRLNDPPSFDANCLVNLVLNRGINDRGRFYLFLRRVVFLLENGKTSLRDLLREKMCTLKISP